jgi:hypothetical protein
MLFGYDPFELFKMLVLVLVAIAVIGFVIPVFMNSVVDDVVWVIYHFGTYIGIAIFVYWAYHNPETINGVINYIKGLVV